MKASLKKVSWFDVRGEAQVVNPDLAAIIDKISPDAKQYWLYRASYPYGGLAMQKSILMLPNERGDIVKIHDSSISDTIREDLSYNLNSNPVSLVLKNSFEIFLPLEDRTIPLSGLITPGSAFGAWRVLNPDKAENPAFLWDMTSGARSVFMLPKITETLRHNVLKNKYDLIDDVPRSLIRHWQIFKNIANHAIFPNKWNAEIIYFPYQWFKHLDDPEWAPFYNYFKNSAWGGTEFWRNQPIYNLIFSLILKDYEGRPSAYIMDTVKYIINIAAGVFPGLSPARDDSAGPFREIQRIYTEEYGLGYAPIILQPASFDLHNPDANPIYYSLNFPSAFEFRPNNKARINLLGDLREVKSLMIRYEKELLSGRFNIEHTTLNDVFKLVKFDYFHTGSGAELLGGIRDSNEMIEGDSCLRTSLAGQAYKDYPSKVLFLNGCIRLSLKNRNH